MKFFHRTNHFALLAAAALTVACSAPKDHPAEVAAADFTTIIPTLEATTADWNKGDLDKFITMYDSAGTFMTPKGPIGVQEMKAYYQEVFIDGKPASALSFDSLEVRPLGESHALVTGRYTLTATDSTKQSGRYSLVFANTKSGWKILHDHSN
ncbi:uncharacterized protein (TIGR02246 family) [Pontibacter ummariensis]|uniref:DUF4440 domain-containing protein n=1 Tax=Pontibacter ummariensis TaxID=1610492 RepID=A0A239IJ66_9BACT|nr:nuclear transport factor 2 family protein [Pontibacter ummariensis]PRY09872.1 uncharacterized protein (TIGR02246 family) [Pontibacter ummariensis]SNS93569.1 conserved hypothetical protein [Pontibacter ummariensis]